MSEVRGLEPVRDLRVARVVPWRLFGGSAWRSA
jgi:hypothetical protein